MVRHLIPFHKHTINRGGRSTCPVVCCAAPGGGRGIVAGLPGPCVDCCPTIASAPRYFSSFPSLPPCFSTMSTLKLGSKKRKFVVVHDRLLINAEMVDTQPGTAVFTTYDWAQSQGLVANIALNLLWPGHQVCLTLKSELDRHSMSEVGPRTQWNGSILNLVVRKSETKMCLEARFPRGVIYLIPQLISPSLSQPRFSVNCSCTVPGHAQKDVLRATVGGLFRSPILGLCVEFTFAGDSRAYNLSGSSSTHASLSRGRSTHRRAGILAGWNAGCCCQL